MADNEYPADEFDRLANARTTRGTHRHKGPNLKWWLALVAVAILTPTAGWTISNCIGSSEEEPAPTAFVKGAPLGVPSGASPTVDPSGDPSSSGGNKPSESGKLSGDPSADVSAIPSGQGGSTSTDAGTGRPVPVLNGSKKPGLAATGKRKLKKASYMKVPVSNYNGGSPAVSTAFYVKVSDVQATKQVVTALDIRPDNVVLAPKAARDDQIVVVSCADAR